MQLDEHGTSWALAAELLALYDIPYDWDAPRRRIQIGAVGWPLFEMSLQSGLGQVILRGVLRQNRAWCRVLEFAEEFGITASFEPFRLGERRGG